MQHLIEYVRLHYAMGMNLMINGIRYGRTPHLMRARYDAFTPHTIPLGFA